MEAFLSKLYRSETTTEEVYLELCQTSNMEFYAKIVSRKGLAVNPFSANITKWSNTFKQIVRKLTTNCLSVFNHFVILALKGLAIYTRSSMLDV